MFNSKLKAQVADLTKALGRNNNDALLITMRHNLEIEKLQRRLRQSENMRLRDPEMVEFKTLVGLKFDALYKGVYLTTVFTTGPGKCGKTVKSFSISKADRTLTIHQRHTDGSSKDFEYRLSDIDGRIQYDYEMTKVPRSETIEILGTRFMKPTL